MAVVLCRLSHLEGIPGRVELCFCAWLTRIIAVPPVPLPSPRLLRWQGFFPPSQLLESLTLGMVGYG